MTVAVIIDWILKKANENQGTTWHGGKLAHLNNKVADNTETFQTLVDTMKYCTGKFISQRQKDKEHTALEFSVSIWCSTAFTRLKKSIVDQYIHLKKKRRSGFIIPTS